MGRSLSFMRKDWNTLSPRQLSHHQCSGKSSQYMYTPHGLPMRAKYGVPILSYKFDLCYMFVTALLYSMSSYIGPCWPDCISFASFSETSEHNILSRVDSRPATSQWEMALQSNAISHWLDASLESALHRQVKTEAFPFILGRELCPSGDSPNQRSRWKHAFSPLKHV